MYIQFLKNGYEPNLKSEFTTRAIKTEIETRRALNWSQTRQTKMFRWFLKQWL
jgi:hypothetical protein